MAFDTLSSELARRQLRADMFVVGGAAIAISYNNSWLLETLTLCSPTPLRCTKPPELLPDG
jgi:hypothetical protein